MNHRHGVVGQLADTGFHHTGNTLTIGKLPYRTLAVRFDHAIERPRDIADVIVDGPRAAHLVAPRQVSSAPTSLSLHR